MTLPELLQKAAARLPELLPSFLVEELGGRERVAQRLLDEGTRAHMLVVSTLAIALDAHLDEETYVLDELDNLSKTCPGAGAEGLTPVQAASAAYKMAMRVVRHGRS